MQLFYNPNIDATVSQFVFDKIESKHVVKVLRKKEGDTLHITNGKGHLFTCQIIIASDKKCVASIIASKEMPPHRDYVLHVAIAPTKNNDRMEWFLEKATEIGIDEITPIICDNSERRVVKIERFQKILQSAMKQSLQFQLPKLNDPMLLSDFMMQKLKGSTYIAHCEDGEKKGIKDLIGSKQNVTILIGPEGDFSSKEITTALEKGYIPISLGETRLRTETAGIVAVQNIAFINQ
ncbi:16S rRNA (uracil(1498)-N(3))-methyltransferase [Flavobacteriaceae bacterium S356]|uniref:Ribosomal RNA small subunit methyltransferase E n=1 Tax=Asprobacillus argus TaxID=3076534 RepID=A0ABU3LIA6_9FLAO|nr:16S rRNA (uracil(1498)-N(3))-methyltransferase [Flavobacteriaceae bacterium S356]